MAWGAHASVQDWASRPVWMAGTLVSSIIVPVSGSSKQIRRELSIYLLDVSTDKFSNVGSGLVHLLDDATPLFLLTYFPTVSAVPPLPSTVVY